MPRPALSRRARLGATTVAAVVAGTAVFGIGQATAEHSVPRTDKEIPNLTQVHDKIKAYYVGFGGDGHWGRLNVSHQFYQAFGEDELNGIAGQKVDINAQFAVFEGSIEV